MASMTLTASSVSRRHFVCKDGLAVGHKAIHTWPSRETIWSVSDGPPVTFRTRSSYSMRSANVEDSIRNS
jgi:hypothetical protein